MKKYIRTMLDDLKRKPPTPKVTKLDPPPQPLVPEDLDNQELSDDPLQRTRQLDHQAQKSKERQLLS